MTHHLVQLKYSIKGTIPRDSFKIWRRFNQRIDQRREEHQTMSPTVIIIHPLKTQTPLSKDQELLKAQVTPGKESNNEGWELVSWTCSATVSWITRLPTPHNTSSKALLSEVKLTTCGMPNRFNLQTSRHETSSAVASSNSELFTTMLVSTLTASDSDPIRWCPIRRFQLIDRLPIKWCSTHCSQASQ